MAGRQDRPAQEHGNAVDAGPRGDAGCITVDPVAILRVNGRSFAFRVADESLAGLDLNPRDIAVGEFTPEVRAGTLVMALIDGEPVLRRVVNHLGRLHLANSSVAGADLMAVSDVVIQGVIHTVVRRLR